MKLYLVCILSLVALVSGAFDPSKYPSSQKLDPLDYTVYWRVDAANNEIYIALRVLTTGWIGFGIAEISSGSMQGADIIVGYHDSKTGKGYVTDRWSYDRVMPGLDDCQNVTLISSEEANGYTVLEIKRAINTSDPQDRSIVYGPNRVIASFSFDGTDDFAYHGTNNRRTDEITFFGEALYHAVDPAGDMTKDITMNNFTVPYNVSTVYACQAFQMPTDKDYYITQIDPIIMNVQHVHHIQAHVCMNSSTSGTPLVQKYYNKPQTCGSPLGQIAKGCYSLISGWAAGGGSTFLPNDVGFPMGPKSTSVQWIIIEVHYNNPSGSTPYSDNSGLRIHYTAAPKKYDASVIILGDPFVKFTPIPPQAITEYEAECTADCTNKFSSDIVVFNSYPHMHNVGTKLWTTQWRDGNMIDEIGRVEYWAFNHQLGQSVNKTVKKGDRLNTHCVYNTMAMTANVNFGSATTQEMCMHFISYYPRIVTPNNQTYAFCGAAQGYTMCGADTKTDLHLDVSNPLERDPVGGNVTRFGPGGHCVPSSPTDSPTPSPIASAASSVSQFSLAALVVILLIFVSF